MPVDDDGAGGDGGGNDKSGANQGPNGSLVCGFLEGTASIGKAICQDINQGRQWQRVRRTSFSAGTQTA